MAVGIMTPTKLETMAFLESWKVSFSGPTSEQEVVEINIRQQTGVRFVICKNKRQLEKRNKVINSIIKLILEYKLERSKIIKYTIIHNYGQRSI